MTTAALERNSVSHVATPSQQAAMDSSQAVVRNSRSARIGRA